MLIESSYNIETYFYSEITWDWEYNGLGPWGDEDADCTGWWTRTNFRTILRSEGADWSTSSDHSSDNWGYGIGTPGGGGGTNQSNNAVQDNTRTAGSQPEGVFQEAIRKSNEKLKKDAEDAAKKAEEAKPKIPEALKDAAEKFMNGAGIATTEVLRKEAELAKEASDVWRKYKNQERYVKKTKYYETKATKLKLAGNVINSGFFLIEAIDNLNENTVGSHTHIGISATILAIGYFHPGVGLVLSIIDSSCGDMLEVYINEQMIPMVRPHIDTDMFNRNLDNAKVRIYLEH